MTDTTADTTTEQSFNSREALRKGFLAYIGLYGTAYDSARKFVNGKGKVLFNDFIKKGEEVESRVQESYADFRQRAEQKYAEQVENIENFFSRVSNDDSVEVEVEDQDDATEPKAPARKRVASKVASDEVVKAA